MFNKIKVKLNQKFENGYSNSETGNLSNKQLLEHLSKLRQEYGNIIIHYIDVENGIIHLTTQDSIEITKVDQKIEEIKDLIIDYVNK